MNSISSEHFKRLIAVAFAAISLLGLAACTRRGHRVLEVAYVSAPQAVLRDQVAAIYNRVGTVKNGERVEVMEHEKRFARVRTATGTEGWIEQRFLVDQKIYDGLQKLTQDNQNDPVQAPGVLRNDTNLHIAPGRDTEHLYLLTSGAKVSLLKRGTAEKQTGSSPISARLGSKAAAGPALEDWWLARDAQGRVGWVLSRMVDVDAPLEIAQYAEGQRFMAFFVLNEVRDSATEKPVKSKKGAVAASDPSSSSDQSTGKLVSQYLCVLTDPHDGLPYDFDQIRVFTWNVRKHRYETAYREHGLNGVLPVTVAKEDFDKEGTLPVFILRVKDDAGNVSERKYKLNTPIVRRVLAPGEIAAKPVAKRRRR
ncbi:MAG TPA: SH3 domain-containing protein [Candidatus Sulfotelmatobacter sp.]